MTAQEKIQKVTEISQSKGWSISVDDKNKSNIQFDFQRYTNYGQDFNFSAEMKCEDIDTLIADMEQYFEGFDPDYEAYLWIGNDGHGKNGAPYHIKDIVRIWRKRKNKYTTCWKHLRQNLSNAHDDDL